MKEQLPRENGRQLCKTTQLNPCSKKTEEESLTGHDEQFRTLLESMEDSIYLVDRKGRYLFMNKKHLSRIDQTLGDVVGRSYANFHPSGDTRAFKEDVKNVFKSGTSLQQEYVSRVDDRYFLRNFSPVKKTDGEVSLVMVLSRDITEQKRAENALRENKQFLDAIFNSIQDGISVLDPELNIMRVNRTMNIWYDHMVPLEGKKCYQAYHERSAPCEVCPTKRSLNSGKLEMNEVVLTKAQGVSGTLELYAFPMLGDSGRPVGVVEYVRDITKRKRAEDALKKSAEKIKMFAYSVAHDLKNPAIAICLLSENLHRKYKDILDDKGRNYCKHIFNATKQLADLVEQINAYISSKEAPLRIEPLNLNQLLGSVREEFSAQIDDRRIVWTQPENRIEINADRLSMIRVMRNLVDNALKYAGDALSGIDIGYEESDEFHVISVADDGVGLDQGDTGKVFNVFHRAMTSNGIDGTGFGLSIVHEIADRHKGRVWAEPGRKSGSVFYVSISKDLK